MFGISGEMTQLYVVVTLVVIIGSIYALSGGLNSCAVSDTWNGIGLLIGGFLITWFAFSMLGGDSVSHGIRIFSEASGTRLNSIGAHDAEAPFFGLFSGILLINVFYWCTNQQIIQRTLGASSLAEGQKGVLLTGLLKLIGPLYLVLPGMIAAVMFMQGMLDIPLNSGNLAASDRVYGALVNAVLPAPLKGFFAAVLLGAILSSYNSALNSTCTLYSLGIYKRIYPDASEQKMIRSGRVFGFVIAIGAILIAPMLAKTGSIFNYLQKMNAIYFIPIFSVVLIGMLTKKVPGIAARAAMIAGVLLIGIGYFVPPFTRFVDAIGQYHFVGLVFLILLIGMLIWGRVAPRQGKMPDMDAHVLDMTPWKYAWHASAVLLLIVIALYAYFADFSVFRTGKPAYPQKTYVVK